MAGCAGGPALPLIQQAVAVRLDAQRRGQYMGWVQGLGGGLLAAIVGPIAFVPLANAAGWKAALLVLAAGAVVLAFAIAQASLPRRASDTRSTRSPAPDNTAQTPRHYASDMSGNSAVCAIVGGLMVGWLVLGTTFFPLYLEAVGGLSTGDMSRTMAVVGAGGLFGLLTIPRLSDRFGRRAVLVLGALLGCASPLALLLPELSLNAQRLFMFAGSAAGGTFPLFLAVIPSESGPGVRIAQRVGIVQAASELSGGVLAPLLAGWLADRHGLRSAVLLAALAPLAAGIAALGVRNVRRAD
jgi:MFS family permease